MSKLTKNSKRKQKLKLKPLKPVQPVQPVQPKQAVAKAPLTPAQPVLKLADGRSIPYTVRLSARAKYLRMQLFPDKGLVVTQPQGVCEHRLQEWVNTQRDWVAKHLLELAQKQQQPLPPAKTALPTQIELLATGETFKVIYTPTDRQNITLDQGDDGHLRLSGAVENSGFCQFVLQKWLLGHAKYHLGIQLQQVMRETGLHCCSYRVKHLSSRWGSYSGKGNVNLNCKLLLLPPECVRYTLIHELCHTREMNHSPRFWALVESFMPEYQEVHDRMKHVMHTLPGWVNS